MMSSQCSAKSGTWPSGQVSFRLKEPSMPTRPPFPGSRVALVASLLGLFGFGCAHRGPAAPTTPATAGPVIEYEMEPIKITAVNDQDGTHIEAFDAAELFEQGGKALGEKRFDDAL